MSTNQDVVAATTERYFDLHTSGVGYLNRVREVLVKKGSFLAADISALRGSADDVEYTRFDCRVSGAEAQTVVRQLMPELEAKKKVLIGFKIGDLYAEPFTYTKGEKSGQTGISLKARLLFITFAKVDGQLVYQAPRNTEADASDTRAESVAATEAISDAAATADETAIA